jgi:hypothetical protein
MRNYDEVCINRIKTPAHHTNLSVSNKYVDDTGVMYSPLSSQPYDSNCHVRWTESVALYMLSPVNEVSCRNPSNFKTSLNNHISECESDDKMGPAEFRLQDIVMYSVDNTEDIDLGGTIISDMTKLGDVLNEVKVEEWDCSKEGYSLLLPSEISENSIKPSQTAELTLTVNRSRRVASVESMKQRPDLPAGSQNRTIRSSIKSKSSFDNDSDENSLSRIDSNISNHGRHYLNSNPGDQQSCFGNDASSQESAQISYVSDQRMSSPGKLLSPTKLDKQANIFSLSSFDSTVTKPRHKSHPGNSQPPPHHAPHPSLRELNNFSGTKKPNLARRNSTSLRDFIRERRELVSREKLSSSFASSVPRFDVAIHTPVPHSTSGNSE